MTEADCVQVDDDTGDDCSAWPPVSSGTVYNYEVEESFGSAVLSRRFKAYVPSRVTSPSPLLIYLHGGTGNGQQQLLSEPFASFADGRPWSWRPNTDSCQFVSPTWPYYKNPATNATCLPPVVDITYDEGFIAVFPDGLPDKGQANSNSNLSKCHWEDGRSPSPGWGEQDTSTDQSTQYRDDVGFVNFMVRTFARRSDLNYLAT